MHGLLCLASALEEEGHTIPGAVDTTYTSKMAEAKVVGGLQQGFFNKWCWLNLKETEVLESWERNEGLEERMD